MTSKNLQLVKPPRLLTTGALKSLSLSLAKPFDVLKLVSGNVFLSFCSNFNVVYGFLIVFSVLKFFF